MAAAAAGPATCWIQPVGAGRKWPPSRPMGRADGNKWPAGR